MILGMLALLGGAVLATVAPVGQFAIGLLVVTVTAAGIALGTHATWGTVLPWTIGLFACSQVGFAFGVVAVTLLRHRHDEALARRRDRHVHEPLLK